MAYPGDYGEWELRNVIGQIIIVITLQVSFGTTTADDHHTIEVPCSVLKLPE